MYKGAYATKKTPVRRRRVKKPSALLLALVALLGAVVGSTVAYLWTNSDAITNTFSPSHVTCKIEETFENDVKSNVSVKNTSDIEAYIRATYVVTWKDAGGNIAPQQPGEGDYTIALNATDWFKGSDGYYYHKAPVAAGANTKVLINTCSPVAGKAPEGYTLNVEILASAIQSVPSKVVEEAWKVVHVDANNCNLVGGAA